MAAPSKGQGVTGPGRTPLGTAELHAAVNANAAANGKAWDRHMGGIGGEPKRQRQSLSWLGQHP